MELFRQFLAPRSSLKASQEQHFPSASMAFVKVRIDGFDRLVEFWPRPGRLAQSFVFLLGLTYQFDSNLLQEITDSPTDHSQELVATQQVTTVARRQVYR